MSEINLEKKEKPFVSIGFPVYNSEKHLKRSLDAILKQTFSNFELIISDNASSDSTPDICKEYMKNDSRIRYFRQEKNLGLIGNFNFVLQKAEHDYFMWTAADDVIAPEFLEKNLNCLLGNKNAVGCMSKVKFYGEDQVTKNHDKIDFAFRNFMNKFKNKIKPRGIYSILGDYEKKVNFFLHKSLGWIIFCVYRTDCLHKSMVDDTFVGTDNAILLNVLRQGDIIILDEILINIFDAGTSGRGIISHSKNLNSRKFGIIFPYYPFTFWCAKNLGSKLFLKNFDSFIILNAWGVYQQLIDLIRIFLHKIYRN